MDIYTLLQGLPSPLVRNLTVEFQYLHEQYYLGKWQASQLNGGRFGEAVLRIIEYKDIGNFTPLGTQLHRENIINHVQHNGGLPDSLRLTIPKLAAIIMDFRNNRNVAHLGTIEVNGMDSSFVIHTANWIMAELVRIEGQTTPEDAQNEIIKIIDRKIPVVEEINGRLKPLNPSLSTKNKTLVCLYQRYPQAVSDLDLLTWIKDKNPTRFRGYIKVLDKEDLVDYTDGQVVLTRRGLAWTEKNIQFELQV